MKIWEMTYGKKNKSVYAYVKAVLIGCALLFVLTGLFGCTASGRSGGTADNPAAASTNVDDAPGVTGQVPTSMQGAATSGTPVSEAPNGNTTTVSPKEETTVVATGDKATVVTVDAGETIADAVPATVVDAADGAAATTSGTEVVAEETSAVQSGQPDASQTQAIDPNTGKDRYRTDVVPEGKPVPIEPEDMNLTDVARSCTLSISCATLLDNQPKLNPEKVELVPEDGFILQPATVTFYEGESVFNVLQREMKKNRIHMEFVSTAIFNSAYIEGIGNIYEFDSGELSGWMYKVNGWFPNYGCSRYQLQEGDVIEWVYTCDLGRDIGGADNAAGQMGLR